MEDERRDNNGPPTLRGENHKVEVSGREDNSIAVDGTKKKLGVGKK